MADRVADMLVKELKAELKSRGLSTSGRKKALVKRLEKAIAGSADGAPPLSAGDACEALWASGNDPAYSGFYPCQGRVVCPAACVLPR